jgi:hypothetical protein
VDVWEGQELDAVRPGKHADMLVDRLCGFPLVQVVIWIADPCWIEAPHDVFRAYEVSDDDWGQLLPSQWAAEVV